MLDNIENLQSLRINDIDEMAELINNTNDNDIEKLVYMRLKALEEDSKASTIAFFSNGKNEGGIFPGYINSNTGIKASFQADPFYINDPKIYVEFIKKTKDHDLGNIVSIFNIIGNFNAEKFGAYGSQEKREDIYPGYTEDNQKISISEYYNKDAALCIERSTVAQNLLSFLGIKSNLVLGKLIMDGKVEQHAYNIVETRSEKLLLLDITNPVLLKKDGVNYNTVAFNILEDGKNIGDLNEIKFDSNYIALMYNMSLSPLEKEKLYEMSSMQKETESNFNR